MFYSPELDRRAQAQVTAALRGGNPDDIVAKGSFPIRRSDIALLSGLNWLNDEVRDKNH